MAADNKNYEKLSGPKAQWNACGHVQLRFEAIDGLETHYSGHHQPKNFALKGRDELLKELKIKDTEWNEKQTKVISTEDGTKGYILARVVESHRRPVAFVFSGEIDEKDGSNIYLDAKMVKKSVNYQLTEKGLVFPTYYTGLFPDLRDVFTKAVIKARKGKKGLWKNDKTNTGFTVKDIDDVTDKYVILPKLFRRIIAFMGDGGKIGKFKAFLKEQNDGLIIIPDAHVTRLDYVIDITGNKVTLTEKPENLVFIEK